MPVSEAEDLFAKLDREARAGGYLLNPNREDTQVLCEGLLTNIKRYGYQSCPCRVAEGNRESDRDLICPCDYRDPDLNDWGACFCALYVTREWIEGNIERKVVPERRPPKMARQRMKADSMAAERRAASGAAPLRGGYPVWRCKVCGYLCAREHPPGLCPICKATADRFERFT